MSHLGNKIGADGAAMLAGSIIKNLTLNELSLGSTSSATFLP